MTVRRSFAVMALICLVPALGHAQDRAKSSDQRAILEQMLAQNYQPAQVGKRAMGVGAETDVRKPGTIVVILREGLYASLQRNEIAASAIHGMDAELYRGHQDFPVPAGERFYVISVHVGLSTVDIGLLSARALSLSQGSGRVWTDATFYFSEDTLAKADKDAVFHEIEQWFVPEGRAGISSLAAPSSPSPAKPAIEASVRESATAAAPLPAAPAVSLAPGMKRDQVVSLLGKPLREVQFQAQTWMYYPAMIIVLRDGNLVSVESAATAASAAVAVSSEPAGAEIYIDGQFTGSTPSTLQLPVGNHQVTLQLPGYQDWRRELKVLPGSDLHLGARLEKR